MEAFIFLPEQEEVQRLEHALPMTCLVRLVLIYMETLACRIAKSQLLAC
jgi:hypothetical protein